MLILHRDVEFLGYDTFAVFELVKKFGEKRTDLFVFDEVLFLIFFFAEDSGEDFFHFVVLKHFGSWEFQFFDFFEYLAKVRLDGKVSQLPGPEAYSFDSEVHKFPGILLIFFFKCNRESYLLINT